MVESIYRLKDDLSSDIVTIKSRVKELQQEIDNKAKLFKQLEMAVEHFHSLPDMVPKSDYIHLDYESQQLYPQKNQDRETVIVSPQQMTISDNVQYENSTSANIETMNQNSSDETMISQINNFSFDRNSSLDSVDNEERVQTPDTSNRPLIEVTSSSLQVANDPKKRHLCHICGKAFSREAYLKQHSACHSDEHPFECEYCGKLFKFKTSWRYHGLTHTKKWPYKCNQCDKGYFSPKQLSVHMNKHTDKQ